jgi:hypothetical protein
MSAFNGNLNAANDDLSLYAVLATRAACINFAIKGDGDLEREHGRTFGLADTERADLYAYEVASTLGITLTFGFAREVRDDA